MKEVEKRWQIKKEILEELKQSLQKLGEKQ